MRLKHLRLDATLVRNTLWMMGAHGGRLVVQGAYFVLLARSLGTEGFGLFTGALSLVYMVAPFAGWGSGNILIREVARDTTRFSMCWGNALVVSLISGTAFTMAIGVAGAWLLPMVPLPLIISLALAELICGRIIDTAAQAFQALERLGTTARITLALTTARLLAASVYLITTDSPTAHHWGYWYLAVSLLVAIAAIAWVTIKIGSPRPKLKRFLAENVKLGGYFAAGASAHSIYTDIDKTMLTRLSTLEAVGIYSAAYRVINLAFTPVRSLLYASYARFFQDGQKGLQGSLALAKRLVPLAGVYGAVSGVALLLFAPLVAVILGDEYRTAIEAIRLLALVPLMQAFHYFAADALTGAGYQGTRTMFQVGVAGLNILLNLALVGRYSWRGAAWATLGSECALAIGLWLIVLYIKARERNEQTCRAESSG